MDQALAKFGFRQAQATRDLKELKHTSCLRKSKLGKRLAMQS